MTPREVLARLEAEGVTLSLNLKVKADAKPSEEAVALLQEHKGALLEHLIREHTTGLDLPAVLLESLMVWVATYYELTLTHPGGTRNVTPQAVRDAAALHPWGVVMDAERYRILSWGAVPAEALQGVLELGDFWRAQDEREVVVK